MRRIFRTLAVAWTLATCTQLSAQTGPLAIAPGDSHVFPADARLNIQTEATIEFWVAAARDTEKAQCLFSHGTGDDTAYRVATGGNRKSLLLAVPGEFTFSFSADLSDGAYHHVALVFSGGRVMAYVDGEVPQLPGDDPDVLFPLQPQFLQPGNGGTAGAPLVLGCDEGAAFQGHLLSWRLWRQALNPLMLEDVKRYTTIPRDRFGLGGMEELVKQLVAYAVFGKDSPRLFYTETALSRRADAGLVERGSAQLIQPDRIAPPEGLPNARLSRVYLRTGFRGIQSLRFEFESFNRAPIILPRAADWSPADDARMAELDRAALRADPNNDLALAAVRAEARRLQIGFDPVEDPMVWGSTDWTIHDLDEGQRITGFVGRHDTNRILSLKILTNRGALPMAKAQISGSEIFVLRVPDFTELAGFELFLGDNRAQAGSQRHFEDRPLRALSLMTREVAIDPELEPLLRLTPGLWQHRAACAPRLNDELAFLNGENRPVTDATGLHGLYTTPAVVRLRLDPARRALEMHVDGQRSGLEGRTEAFDVCGAAQTGARVLDTFSFLRSDNLAANALQGLSTTRRRLLRMEDGGAALTFQGSDDALAGPLVRVPPQATASADRIAWGGTFALPHRPANLRASFVGYDITHLDPHNFLRSHGLKKNVFAYPDDDSTDYQTTDNNLIVPLGVMFQGNLGGSERGRTIMVGGAQEYKRAWSVSLGFNIGFGLDGLGGAFSANGTYAKRSQSRVDREVVTSITRTMETRYALILDKARMTLDPGFVAMVLKQRDRLLLDEAPVFQELIFSHGTHYPYAVTYGGMAFLETDYTKSVVDHMTGQSISFEEQASLSFASQSGENGCGCSGGGSPFSANIGASTAITDDRDLATEARQSDQSHRFGVYGGAISRGEGWSLAPGQEVPLFYDLRPLNELLSPVFFDDPLVWQVLAPALQEHIRTHLRRAAATQSPDKTTAWFHDRATRARLNQYEETVWDHSHAP